MSEKAVFKGLRMCISNAILHFKCYFAIGSLGSLGLVHSILDVGSRFKSSSIGLIHSVYIIQYSFKLYHSCIISVDKVEEVEYRCGV